MIFFSNNNSNFLKDNVPLFYLRTKEASLPIITIIKERREPRIPLIEHNGTLLKMLLRAVRKVSY